MIRTVLQDPLVHTRLLASLQTSPHIFPSHTSWHRFLLSRLYSFDRCIVSSMLGSYSHTSQTGLCPFKIMKFGILNAGVPAVQHDRSSHPGSAPSLVASSRCAACMKQCVRTVLAHQTPLLTSQLAFAAPGIPSGAPHQQRVPPQAKAKSYQSLHSQ